MINKLLVLYFLYNIFLVLKFVFYDHDKIMEDEEIRDTLSRMPEEYHKYIMGIAYAFVLVSLLLAGGLFSLSKLINIFRGD